VADDRDVAGVVAHGLLNNLAVVSGAAATMLMHGDKIGDDVAERLTIALVGHCEVLAVGLEVLVRHSSIPFGEAAETIAAVGPPLTRLSLADRRPTLDGVVQACRVLHEGLRGLVQGLPSEVIDTLEALQRAPILP
jgi:hypothetical protein